MCLYVKRGCKPEIAQKDIVCYKVVVDRGRSWEPACGYSNNHFPYNKVLTAEYCINGEIRPIQHLKIRYVTNYYCRKIRRVVEEGFHAECKRTYTSTNLCVIPKGTEYCLGEEDEVVAVNMIVFKSTLDYCWYKIKKLWHKR